MEVSMLRERISEEIYVFTSDLYAQVTAGVIVTSKGAVVVDTDKRASGFRSGERAPSPLCDYHP
jgi:hypothetical protein